MSERSLPSLGWSVLLAAMAGGMGWGIRGQYGHQTGAMIAGLLVGLVLVLRFVPQLSSLSGARIVALLTLGVSLGGSMTYGQTVGLTHDAPLIGNWEALQWGLLGLFIKGGVWIGLAGFFLGVALSGKQYRPTEMALMIAGALFVRFVGMEFINEPYAPVDRLLPQLYFSDHWYWEPESDLKPRRELWGGLLVALLALAAYARLVRHDRLVLRLTVWGFVAGGMGFSTGQCIQAMHAWRPEWFNQGVFAAWSPYINWWNMMEISFGAIFAAILTVGVGRNRELLAEQTYEPEFELSVTQEALLGLLHGVAIVSWSFGDFSRFDSFADMAFTMILIPAVAVCAGRFWPYWMVLPIVLIPIAGKTLRQVTFETDQIPAVMGWTLIILLPIGLALILSVYLAVHGSRHTARTFARVTLLLVTWIYFSLNWVFFEFPWPWQEWTGRTPSGLLFWICAVGLSVACLCSGNGRARRLSTTASELPRTV